MTKSSYATPTDDQIAWRDAGCTSAILPAHIVAFVQSGVTATLGVRGPDGRPIVGVGVACRVRDMIDVRVLLSRNMNASLIGAVQQGSAVSATFTSARDHRSIQLKTHRADIREILPDDPSEAARQSAILAEELIELGYTRIQADAYAFRETTDLVSLEFRADRVFTQTPGPGAGAELPR